MKFTETMLIAGITALLSTTALADATSASVSNAPNGGPVTLSGTVEDFDNAHSFTLRDNSGTVKVDLSAAKSVVLKNGETVDVTGTVNKGVLGTTVVATSINEDKAVGQQIGEAIDSVTGQDAAGSAKVVNIRSLPKTGLVKVTGMVESVSNQKKFTLKDSTGHVDVNITSGESASLNKGAQVTVVGHVDNGILSKSINATEVDVQSNGTPATKE